MNMEEAMLDHSDPNVVLLNAVLAKFSDDPNESVESRFGWLIVQYFKGDTQRFLTTMKEPLPS